MIIDIFLFNSYWYFSWDLLERGLSGTMQVLGFVYNVETFDIVDVPAALYRFRVLNITWVVKEESHCRIVLYILFILSQLRISRSAILEIQPALGTRQMLWYAAFPRAYPRWASSRLMSSMSRIRCSSMIDRWASPGIFSSCSIRSIMVSRTQLLRKSGASTKIPA